MRKIVIALSVLAVLTSCVSKKKYTDLEARNKETQDLLNSATVKLNSCLEEKAGLSATVAGLKEHNQTLINTSKDMTVLTTKGAENIEKALESIKEKDLKISRMQDALTKKDSVTLAVVTSLKSAVGISDPDIEINVEKGVVFISIADKLLFKTGSYDVTDKAKSVLAKVAKVVNDKPDFECMVEGHTDNVPYNGSGVLLDNWDLSVKRSTSIIRVLTNQLGVKPEQLIAAGRSSYVPLVANDSAENRSRNRRTRIVVLPKIDQFYEMIEKEMKKQKQ
ncbi:MULTISPECIES: OmpA/MotB family protein [Flavobacterium]|uniref:OmpA family protein n=1 Tax=Flavobacterium gawalongense TaxID=2594432 RepID=A0A553BD49_9FLAO|nr:OmpA family protein [Flavobacterium gawalongense]TRW98473.1 OmpA family protein [Flavobacterium gawalongense]TRX02850.1 OmpA family protein [Flavobacterium gawalongense]TRX06170.1 OmpA family protein [Flavobacterium gawalongense]TRX06902.1 OmpA family protein [Flavobacterium gawalongense]TRX22532.1 OmpA family protein [Flavobacterium gawalongense]